MTPPVTPPVSTARWTGDWVAGRLDVHLRTTAAAGGLLVRDLVGLAVRVNPRRVHLLVSTVLGKHVPVDPDVVRAAGALLGRLVADRLTGVDSGVAEPGGDLLARALRDGDAGAADRLVELAGTAPAPVPDVLVLGYAETATGLGHLVGDALGADVLHSTRRPVGIAPAGGFEESHSHATGHLLLPDDPALLAGDRPVVLVDDELSTGATVMDTIRGLQEVAPRRRWLVAGLVDLRTDDARADLARFAAEQGIEVDVVVLATGRVELPPDVLARGAALLAAHPHPGPPEPGPATGPVREVAAETTPGFRDGGRHGFTAAHRSAMDAALPRLAEQVHDALGPAPGRVVLLGTEELMHLPVRLAAELSGRGVDVLVSSTTRSPVLPVEDPGYAVRTALRFASHDRPADGPGPRYAYNVAAPPGGRPFDAAVLVVDDASRAWDDGPTALPRVLAGAVAGPVVVLTVPSHRPTPDPLRGPAFGSYAPDEVGWLLTDLSDVPLEAPVEHREAAIQSGRAHYSESLPVEYQPGAAYLELFEQGLAASARRLAVAVGVLTELVLARRPDPPVLVSLARAGTPIGVLVRRWAGRHGLDLPHLAVSIVRGRGLDPRALDHLAAHHDPADVVFVDGWTGKGAITRELQAAVRAAEAAQPRGFVPDLAVVADPGGCTDLFGTREDFLIPSACLNSTVSGLVSRTVLRADLVPIGGYHGAKFYRELADQDVSGRFLDTVSACFDDVADEVADEVARQSAAPVDRAPTWAGWRAVEEIGREAGIADLNLVKPGVGETTRVLLRRVPWKVLVRPDRVADLGHVLHLAADRGVPVEERPGMPFSCTGLIRPGRGDA
ncbi:phosphoribosyltransferase [Klenkia sp. LSe6-5]|uniref:Phosphoribosyltransferase n=1 Tax=Klenkia sesuvii TaxID=3103137 RepID=A0ABU8DT76_9ACTN